MKQNYQTDIYTSRTQTQNKFYRFDTMINYTIKSPNQQITTKLHENKKQNGRSSSIAKTKQTPSSNQELGNNKKSKYSSQQSLDDFDYDGYGRQGHYGNNTYSRGKYNTNNNNNNNRKNPKLPEDAFYNPEKNMLYVKKGDNSENTMKTSINVILELERTSSYSTNSSDEDTNNNIIYQTPRFRAGSMIETNQIQEFYDYSSPSIQKCNNKNNEKYWNRIKFKYFDVFFDGEMVATDQTPILPYTSSQVFGGFDMKKGPSPQIDLPTFL